MTSDQPVHVMTYQFGMLAPLDWGDDCDDELRRQNVLWNNLVEIERAHIAAVRAVGTTENPFTEPLAHALERVAEIRRRTKARNAAARRRVESEDLGAELQTARKALQEIAASEKAWRKAAYQANRDKLRALEQERYAAAKRVHQEAVWGGAEQRDIILRIRELREVSASSGRARIGSAASNLHDPCSAEKKEIDQLQAQLAALPHGLFWGNANAIVESFETGRKAARARNGEMHFRHYDGSGGRITNQVQGGISPAELEAGEHSQVQMGPAPAGIRNKRARAITMTVYASGHGKYRKVTWPVIVHRDIPADARIQSVSAHRVRRGRDWRWSVSITVRVPAPAPRTEGPRVAVNLGWRSTVGGLRVATVLREGAIEPEHILLPERIIDGVQLTTRVASEVDEARNRTWLWVSALPRDDMPETVAAELAGLTARRHITARHLAYLLSAWPADWRPDDRRDLAAYLSRNRRTTTINSHRRDNTSERRKRLYEAEALRLLGDAREIVLNVHDMQETARTDSGLHAGARHNRVVAAPYVLRSAINNIARRNGIAILKYGGHNDRCAHCGGDLAVRDETQLFWRCGHCQRSTDQDTNYCRLMLASSGSDAGEAEDARNEENGAKSRTSVRLNRRRRADSSSDAGSEEGLSTIAAQSAQNARQDE